MSVAVVAFSKGQLTVKTTAYDRSLGGRDYALFEYFSKEFKTKVQDRCDAQSQSYSQAEEKSILLTDFSEAEDWQYTEEGEDATESAYILRLGALKVLGDPITFRYKEVDECNKSTTQPHDTINAYMSQVTSTEEKYAHIDEKDKQSMIEKVAAI